VHDVVEMVTVGVRNENLPERITAYNLDYALHPAGVKLVEYVIEQQQRLKSCGICQELILRKPHCNDISLALTLRGGTLEGHRVDSHIEIIAMNTDCRMSYYHIPLKVCLELLGYWLQAIIERRAVTQCHSLGIFTGYRPVIFLKYANEGISPFPTLTGDIVGSLSHWSVYGTHKLTVKGTRIPGTVAQHPVAVLKQGIIPYEKMQVA